jgi:hypothetical protein
MQAEDAESALRNAGDQDSRRTRKQKIGGMLMIQRRMFVFVGRRSEP